MGVRVLGLHLLRPYPPAALFPVHQASSLFHNKYYTIRCEPGPLHGRRFVSVGNSAVDGLASSAPEGLRTVPTLQAETNADVNGHELASHAEEADDRVVTTFRWPAALEGQDISVIGACYALRHLVLPELASCMRTNGRGADRVE